MYPKLLQPQEIEALTIDNTTINVPKCIITFDKWAGEPIKETFGGKPLVAIDDRPMFAELAIMHLFLKSGWNARWIETYGKGNGQPICLTEWKDDKYKNQQHVPIGDINITKILQDISEINSNSYSGCWDVLGWLDGKLLFAESKRTKKDSIRSTQLSWLKAGLIYGLKPENYLMVQWEMQ